MADVMHRRLRTRGRAKRPTAARVAGFTLVELLVVMVIIGILLAFILTAAFAGVRRAEERATQALIMKLEAGMSDRVDAILTTRADANAAHNWLAATFNSGIISGGGGPLPSNNRAQVIARFEQVKADLPDVFLVQTDGNYPLHFGAAPFPGTAVGYAGSPYDNYLLPMGIGVKNDPINSSYGANPPTPGITATNPTITPESTGIFGASYGVMAGLTKNLVAEATRSGAVAAPRPVNLGYDGVDNDNNGMVDDLGENGAAVAAAIKVQLSRHTHKTARSEMLYALLVEGIGPFGSAFSRDEFTDREVRDTDGDGLPEFVDAWGEPLQFYRWPIGHVSDPGGYAQNSTQKGMGVYQTVSPMPGVNVKVSYETREKYPLDPNQRLLDPFWWSNVANNSSPFGPSPAPVTALSNSAYFFQTTFSSLMDPNANPSVSVLNGALWDRSGGARRAYYSRFLIVSGGPDKTPGVPVFHASYYDALGDLMGQFGGTVPAAGSRPEFTGPITTPTSASDTHLHWLRVEDQAAPATFVRTDYTKFMSFYDGTTAYAFPPTDPVSRAINEAGNDDVTSHNLQAPGGATR